jgi:hypothetical protein
MKRKKSKKKIKNEKNGDDDGWNTAKREVAKVKGKGI